MTSVQARQGLQSCFLATVISVVATGGAHADQNESCQTWGAFLAPIETAFAEKRDHFFAFSELVFPQTINDLRWGGEGPLLVQEKEGDPYEPAPASLTPQIPDAFEALGLFGVRSDREVLELAPAAIPEFNGAPVFLSIVYAPELSFADSLCGDRTVSEGVDGGRCWSPLPERGWYIDVIWPEHGGLCQK